TKLGGDLGIVAMMTTTKIGERSKPRIMFYEVCNAFFPGWQTMEFTQTPFVNAKTVNTFALLSVPVIRVSKDVGTGRLYTIPLRVDQTISYHKKTSYHGPPSSSGTIFNGILDSKT